MSRQDLFLVLRSSPREGRDHSQYILIILVDFWRDTHHYKDELFIAKERKKERNRESEKERKINLRGLKSRLYYRIDFNIIYILN